MSEREKATLNQLRQKARDSHPPACDEANECICGIRQAENRRIAERNNPFSPYRTPYYSTPEPRQSAAEEQADQMSTDPTRNP